MYGQFLFESALASGQLSATGGVLWFLQELFAQFRVKDVKYVFLVRNRLHRPALRGCLGDFFFVPTVFAVLLSLMILPDGFGFTASGTWFRLSLHRSIVIQGSSRYSIYLYVQDIRSLNCQSL
jgi:hypothetical protein